MADVEPSDDAAIPADPALPPPTSHEPPEAVSIASLLGPPNLPAPLYDPVPKDEHGRPDWSRLHALVVAVEALMNAGLTHEARPLLAQLRGIVEAARGPAAKVIELGVERSRRES